VLDYGRVKRLVLADWRTREMETRRNSLQRAVRVTGTSCLEGLACEERQGILAKFMN
jgi:hypothetical protein